MRQDPFTLQVVLDAAIRLLDNKYVEWARAGGPTDCAHGYGTGIPCPQCDRLAVDAWKSSHIPVSASIAVRDMEPLPSRVQPTEPWPLPDHMKVDEAHKMPVFHADKENGRSYDFVPAPLGSRKP